MLKGETARSPELHDIPSEQNGRRWRIDYKLVLIGGVGRVHRYSLYAEDDCYFVRRMLS
jgi:hypothetical protein